MTNSSSGPTGGTKRGEHADHAGGETMPSIEVNLPARGAETRPAGRLGRYEILGELGRGGMGVVFKGRDPALDRPVALKVLASTLAAQENFKARFLSEARALARIEHPNVVRVYDVGEDGDQTFFAMEFVQGQPVDQLVKKAGPLPVRDALGILRQAAEGLAAAQQQGILHRDVKPANLVLASDGKVRVLDFGLAKMPGSGGPQTATNVIMGTPEYMSPEQGRGEQPDHRSDIYALGITLYFLLAGAPPFTGTSALGIIQQHVGAPPPPITEKRKDVPEAVQALLAMMLAKDPNDRPSDHALVVRAIDAAASGGAPVAAWPAPFFHWLPAALKSPGAVAQGGALQQRVLPIFLHSLKLGALSWLIALAVTHSGKLAWKRFMLAPMFLGWAALVAWILGRALGGRANLKRAYATETSAAAYLPVLAFGKNPIGLLGILMLLRARWQLMPLYGLQGGQRQLAFVLSTLFLLSLLPP